MSKLPVVFDLRAAEDTEAAADWYEDQMSGLGGRFLEALDEVLARASRLPESFPEADDGIRRALLKGFPFAVYYRTDSERIVVLAVLHNRRHASTWQERSESD